MGISFKEGDKVLFKVGGAIDWEERPWWVVDGLSLGDVRVVTGVNAGDIRVHGTTNSLYHHPDHFELVIEEEEEVMQAPTNVKIYIGDNPRLSEEVQLALFDLGLNWYGCLNEIQFTSSGYLTTREGTLRQGLESAYRGCKLPELTAKAFLAEYKQHKKREKMKDGEFTKDMLEDWMVVALRDGRQYVVNTKAMKLVRSCGCATLDEYMADLTWNGTSEFDIMSVYKASTGFLDFNNAIIHKGELLWKRVEKSSAELEIESIQADMDKMQAKLEELKEQV